MACLVLHLLQYICFQVTKIETKQLEINAPGKRKYTELQTIFRFKLYLGGSVNFRKRKADFYLDLEACV
jgi:hypothetical protein